MFRSANAAAREASGRADAGNIQPDLEPESQWSLARRQRDLETQGVVAEVVFPNGVPFQVSVLDDSAQAADPELTRARLALVRGVKLVIASGLDIIGVEPLEELR